MLAGHRERPLPMAITLFGYDFDNFPDTVKYFPEQARNPWAQKQQELKDQAKAKNWTEQVATGHFQVAERAFARTVRPTRSIVSLGGNHMPLLLVDEDLLTDDTLETVVGELAKALRDKSKLSETGFSTLRASPGWGDDEMVGASVTELKYSVSSSITSGPNIPAPLIKRDYIVSAVPNLTFNNKGGYGFHNKASSDGQVHVEQLVMAQLDAFLDELAGLLEGRVVFETGFTNAMNAYYQNRAAYRLTEGAQTPGNVKLSMKNLTAKTRFYIEKPLLCGACSATRGKFLGAWVEKLSGIDVTL